MAGLIVAMAAVWLVLRRVTRGNAGIGRGFGSGRDGAGSERDFDWLREADESAEQDEAR
jgi:hypothetical protein